jgi:polysaccharide export outer membrane protein
MERLIYSFVAFLLLSCATSKDILYFQDIDQVKKQPIQAEYITRIAKDDLLNIVVTGPDKTVVMPFNLTLNENMIGGYTSAQSLFPYLVDSQGNIDFPVLGRIHVEGLTRIELTNYLTERLQEYIKDPVVVISFTNYKITVLGEVRSPGTYTMPSERTTILQALGMAGDLNIAAERDKVLLIREIDGVQTHVKIDLKSAQIMNSPYFYLHQNDVLYVAPSTSRIVQGTNTASIWSTSLSILVSAVSVVSVILTLTNNNAK